MQYSIGASRLFYVGSTSRSKEIPARILEAFNGVLQTDGYTGYNPVFDPDRAVGPATKGYCWVHGRRNFYDLTSADFQNRLKNKSSKVRLESEPAEVIVLKIDELMEVEETIRGRSSAVRLGVRQQRSAPLVAELKDLFDSMMKNLSKQSELAKAIKYMLRRWDGFTTFLEDGRVCMTNNLAEQGMRPVAQGRKRWLFFRSRKGLETGTILMTLVYTAELNGVDPQAWLEDVLERIKDTPEKDLPTLLPWNWKILNAQKVAA